MDGYEPMRSFDDETAEVYDDTPRGDERETVAFLERLARGGPALELAIGTDRIALPLADLPGLQHAVQPAHAGRTGALLRQRRRAPHRRRRVRRRGGSADAVHAVARPPVRRRRGGRRRHGEARRRPYDPVTQILDETHVHLTRDGVRLFPIVTRYAWPAELDLMARLAGLRLTDRWGGWEGEPFTAASGRHVSVYGR